MAKGNGDPKLGPLTHDEIKNALEKSGYPFELKLFDAFCKAGMTPALGARFHSRASKEDEASSHEIDIIARVDTHQVGFGQHSRASALALIDAKKLHEPSCLVGLLGVQPTQHERRVMRSFFYGCPSFRVMTGRQEDYGHLFIGQEGVSESLDPLSAGPLCAHWARVRREPNGNIKAGGDGPEQDGYWQTIRTLVEVALWNERQSSEHAHSLGVDVGPLPELNVYCPTLIVETPTLYLYQPLTGELTETNWFMLNVSLEVAGSIHNRVVDVVSASGVSEMIERYKETGIRFDAALSKHSAELRRIAIALREHEKEAGRGATAVTVRAPSRRI
jgi:hypothetical protein